MVTDCVVRVRSGAWSAAQCGLAAAGAWAFSTRVLDHQRPFFASVAAVVSLGLTAGGRLRRTAELSAGVALGVGVGDAWVGAFGQGIWQIWAVVFLALIPFQHVVMKIGVVEQPHRQRHGDLVGLWDIGCPLVQLRCRHDADRHRSVFLSDD